MWFFLLFYSICTAVSIPSQEDLLVLLSFKEKLLGNPLSSWRLNNSLTAWEGVQLSEEQFIVALNLSSQDLRGELSPIWCNLRSIKRIYLYHNNLSGELPWCVDGGGNSSIEVLDLSSNHLGGELPKDMRSTTLKELNLGKNNFTGNLTLTFGAMPALQMLDIGWSSLRGPIPMDICEKLPHLVSFSLSSNYLISGTIPQSLSNCSFLERLYLNNNTLSGTIPHRLPSNLIEVDISHNLLSGSIPDTISNCTFLKRLDAGFNKITGTLPNSFGNLSNLMYLALLYNNMHGEVLPNGMMSTKMEVLWLGSNSFTGPIPESLRSCTSLKVLALAENGFQGEVPRWLGNFSELFTLTLSDNNLTGDIPVELGDLKSLQTEFQVRKLNCCNITFTLRGRQSKGLDQFAAYIDLSNNRLTGSIPSELGKLQGLQWLLMSNNLLSGEIPLSLTNIHPLERLNLSGNKLTGQIPRNLGDLNFLSEFDVSYNLLTGAIPYEHQLATFEASSYQGNPGLCGRPLNVTCVTSSAAQQGQHGNRRLHIPLVVGGVVGFVVGLCVALILLPRCFRRMLACLVVTRKSRTRENQSVPDLFYIYESE